MPTTSHTHTVAQRVSLIPFATKLARNSFLVWCGRLKFNQARSLSPCLCVCLVRFLEISPFKLIPIPKHDHAVMGTNIRACGD